MALYSQAGLCWPPRRGEVSVGWNQRSPGRGSVWALGEAGDLQDHRDRAGGDGVLRPRAG